jgi:hypothetical protein
MPDRIYLLNQASSLVAMDETPYDSEDLLQALIANHPDLLAIGSDTSSEAPRWLLISREMAVPGEEGGANRWSLDHLFVDQVGIPTLVEVKRSTDTRIRREVVGQLLDYAANAVVYWPIERIRTRFEATCEESGADAEQVLARHLQDGRGAEDFWQLVKTNLQAGRIRMIFLADVIPAELRRIIEFLNEQMDPAEVLGVEIRQYRGSGLQTLVPRVVGQTASASARKHPSESERVAITEAELDQEARAALPDGEARVVSQLIDWARKAQHALIFKRGANGAVFIPEVKSPRGSLYPISVHVNRGVVLMLHYLKRHPPFDTEAGRTEMLERLKRVQGIELRGGMDGRPRVPFAALTNEGALAQLLESIDWLIERIRAGA